MTRADRSDSGGTARRPRAEAAVSSAIVPLGLQKHKVLRFLQAGYYNLPRLARINRDTSRCSLAVKGDALIYGPNLVAWSVVSERRNHHPHQVIIQTQSVTN
jgi:hypothetical protein